MPSMSVSISEQLRGFVKSRVESGEYHNESEYIRDLIRQDQNTKEKERAFKAAIEMGRNSGLDDRSSDEIFESAKNKAKNVRP